jgi:CheY-like chemotaxis protein
MTVLDFERKTLQDTYRAPCFHCRQDFDLVASKMCDCIARERTFVCPHCLSCACDASYSRRNEFWMSAPTVLWQRRRGEEIDGIARLQSLDPQSLPRPLALIVDDDPLVLNVAERVLRGMGFTTLVTTRPEEAYEIAMVMLPDLMLTDALMPRIDGRELCLRIKRSATREIKIILMSAVYRHVLYHNEAFKKFRVDEYLEKPIKPGVLRDAVDRLMPAFARLHPHSDDVRAAS